MHVRDLMTSTVRTCGSDTTLEQVALMMWDANCGAIPVVDDMGTPVGIITDRDIAMSSALNHRPLWELTARQVLGDRPVYTCTAEDDVRTAMKTMWAQHVRRMPVVDGGGRLRGILSIDDIISRAERGSRGQRPPDLSFDDAITTCKAVANVAH